MTHKFYDQLPQPRINTSTFEINIGGAYCAAHGIGRPTPEGAHPDGVDFVAILLVAREHVKSGESRIFEASSSNGQRFTLTEPWTLLLLDDVRVIHESTPIQPTAPGGHRDTLVLTYRAQGFQEQPE